VRKRGARRAPGSSSWLRLSADFWQAGLEAQQVIGLRLALLAGGREPAAAEMLRMVSEKVAAGFEIQQAAAMAAMTGGNAQIPALALAIYRRRMRANRRRLGAAKPGAAARSGAMRV
jgi:aspartate/methionine/tyrosine aminotransferase